MPYCDKCEYYNDTDNCLTACDAWHRPRKRDSNSLRTEYRHYLKKCDSYTEVTPELADAWVEYSGPVW